MFRKNLYISTYNEHVRKSCSKEYINEVYYTPMETKINIRPKKSEYFENFYDYALWFDTNQSKIESGHTYVLEFRYYKDYLGPFKDKHLFNVSFTTKEQYDLHMDADTEKEASKIYEKPTNKNEREELMQRLIYLFQHFDNTIGNKMKAIYVIGETVDKIKIKYYRSLIKDSLPNIQETEGESSINDGKSVFYFHKK